MAPYRRRAPVLVVAAFALAGCAAAPDTVDPSGVDGLEIPTPTPDPADFVGAIDNPYLPLQPGNEWVYEVTGDDPETVTVTVTDETREVGGVTTTVVRDVVTGADGEVVEETWDWFAQDTEGNVWYFGEDTTEYDERGRPDSAGSWEAGVDGAQAGLAMPATPRLGDGYQQEYYPGEAEDQAEVLSLEESLDLETGSYEQLLVTEDTTPLEPALVERKYYARGTGLVYEETIAGGTEQVELVSFTEGTA